MVKEALLYERLTEDKIRCLNCAHYCLIPPGKRGICGVRENIGSRLYALNYRKAIACHIDPIEKKPFFHFLPASFSLSIAAVGCNFRCLNCQNFDISQGFKGKEEIPGQDLAPAEIVNLALKNQLPSISYTYTEPTIFLEYALETMSLARKKGIKNTFVSNGFMSPQSAKMVVPYLDAINIDIKSFSDQFYKSICGAKIKPVLETAKFMKKSKIWLEITTLVIPTLNDSTENFKKIANFIKKALGAETPWHITQFSGAISWQLQHLPETPVETLEKGWQIGKRAGLKYVYCGNVPGLPSEDTFCPKCKTLCIDRFAYDIHRFDKNGKCPKCKENLNLILK